MQPEADRIIFENRQEVKKAMDTLEDLWEYRQRDLYSKYILGTMYREWQKPL